MPLWLFTKPQKKSWCSPMLLILLSIGRERKIMLRVPSHICQNFLIFVVSVTQRNKSIILLCIQSNKYSTTYHFRPLSRRPFSPSTRYQFIMTSILNRQQLQLQYTQTRTLTNIKCSFRMKFVCILII